jgi:hypothetical protein
MPVSRWSRPRDRGRGRPPHRLRELKACHARPRAGITGHSAEAMGGSTAGQNYLEMRLNRPGAGTPSLTVNGSGDVPVLYPRVASSVASTGESPCKSDEADARTRTGDPFITRERRVRDARPREGTRGHVLAGNSMILQLKQWTRVPARARAYVPVLYPAFALAAAVRQEARSALEAQRPFGPSHSVPESSR